MMEVRTIDRPGRATHGQRSIPEPVLDPLGNSLHVFGKRRLVEEEQVNVRVNVQFATPISPNGSDRQDRRILAAIAEISLLGKAEQSAYQSIDQI
jgi:hypothetical protein